MGSVLHYFAYGSNMSRARLEERIGPVRDHGRARLENHAHRFSKLGQDQTGKGNLEVETDRLCWGVLYEIDEPQLERLYDFELGYTTTVLSVLPALGDPHRTPAVTFVALSSVVGLRPTSAYLEHYRVGAREHGIPDAYVDELLAPYSGILDTPIPAERRPHA